MPFGHPGSLYVAADRVIVPAMPGMNLELINIIRPGDLGKCHALRWEHENPTAEARAPIKAYGTDDVIWACKHVGPGAELGTDRYPIADVLLLRQTAVTHIFGYMSASKHDIAVIRTFKEFLLQNDQPIILGLTRGTITYHSNSLTNMGAGSRRATNTRTSMRRQPILG